MWGLSGQLGAAGCDPLGGSCREGRALEHRTHSLTVIISSFPKG